ncbi:type I methionyl aminopeptidase [Candidatus Sumerlaeota bacterium]|nr:type I methionyl aminopeptidase [Candidatus Sumerlaeota bacterium]
MKQVPEKALYLKSDAEIALMRRAGHLLQRIIREVTEAVHPGITTLELDRLAYSRIKEAKAIPGVLGLSDFPNTLCISVNDEIVHGIPSRRKLVEGDIVSIDCGLILNDFFADTAYTVPVGKISAEAQRLIDVTRQSLYAGINAIKPGGRVGDIGAAVEKVVHEAGYHCTEGYTGHGVGRHLHEKPDVPNDSKRAGIRLQPGMTLAIEPMINQGTSKTKRLKDDWTVVTADGSLSAHFEHTVAITRDGVEILTLDDKLEKENKAHGATVSA